MTLVVKWCLIKIPVCGGVVGDPCVGVGGGVGVERTTDVEPPSGEPVEDVTEHKPLCQLLATCQLLAAWAFSPITAVINGRYRRFLIANCISMLGSAKFLR